MAAREPGAWSVRPLNHADARGLLFGARGKPHASALQSREPLFEGLEPDPIVIGIQQPHPLEELLGA